MRIAVGWRVGKRPDCPTVWLSFLGDDVSWTTAVRALSDSLNRPRSVCVVGLGVADPAEGASEISPPLSANWLYP